MSGMRILSAFYAFWLILACLPVDLNNTLQ